MRALRLLLIFTFGLGALAVVGVANSETAGAAVGTYTAFSADGDPSAVQGDTVGFLATGSQVTAGAVQPATGIEFVAAPGSTYGSANVDLGIGAPTGQALSIGIFETTTTATATAPSLAISVGGVICSASGSLIILDADKDASGNLLDFAATYTYSCNAQHPVTGEVRWNSSRVFADILASPDGWDFGSQTVNTNGTPKTVTVTNFGSTLASFGVDVVSAPELANFSFTDTCGSHTLLPGGSCAITVVPHPAALGVASNAVLSLSVTVQRDPVPVALNIYFAEQGTECCPLNAVPAPGQITVNWGRPQVPFDLAPTHIQLLKGTSSDVLAPIKSFTPNITSFVDPATPGTAYYYAIKPVFGDGTAGQLSPVVAAEDWPKYSNGVYHRFTNAQRLIKGVHVTAGHTYSMATLGLKGIPASGVQALAVDIEASAPTIATSIWAYPAGTTRPAAADLVVPKGVVATDFAIVQVGSGGKIAIVASHGTPSVTIDVTGYFATSALTTQGEGGTLQDFIDPVDILDTNVDDGEALPSGDVTDAPVQFNDADLPSHITSFLVQVTAYSATASGSIAGFATGATEPATTMLAYRAGVTTANTAIIRVGTYTDSDGSFPSVSFLNRGSHSVQLYVSLLGFFDDNTLTFGGRYVPQTPYHILNKTVTSNSNTIIGPSTHATSLTTALMTKMADNDPTSGSPISIAGVKTSTTVGAYPKGGQLHALAHTTTVASTVLTTGFIDNEMRVHNPAGNDPLSFWVFGRFDGWPVPDAPDFATGDATPQVGPGVMIAAARAQVR